MKKLLILLAVVLLASCVPHTAQVMEPTPDVIVHNIEGVNQVATFIYVTEDGIRYRVFTFGNGMDEAGLVVINESLEKEQLKYYSKLR